MSGEEGRWEERKTFYLVSKCKQEHTHFRGRLKSIRERRGDTSFT